MAPVTCQTQDFIVGSHHLAAEFDVDVKLDTIGGSACMAWFCMLRLPIVRKFFRDFTNFCIEFFEFLFVKAYDLETYSALTIDEVRSRD